MWDQGLWAQELRFVARCVEKRRREFTAGRNCVRGAMRQLGFVETAIPVGQQRQPVLPNGLVGSITHTAFYCAAALLEARKGMSIGIDAELAGTLDEAVSMLVLRPSERRHVDWLKQYWPGRSWERMIFSAKESFHKALFRCWPVVLDFQNAEVCVDPKTNSFDLYLPDAHRAGWAGSRHFTGRYRFTGPLVLTTAIVPLQNADHVKPAGHHAVAL